MKKLTLFLLALLMLTGCQKTQSANGLSNLADDASKEEVRQVMEKNVSKDSVDKFFGLVDEFNTAIKNTSLVQGFQETEPTYDIAKMDELWLEKYPDYVGSNCRINTFTILKDSIQIGDTNKDDKLLFIDKEGIDYKKEFSPEEKDGFEKLFSRVATEATSDQKVHAEKMKEHFKNIKFDDKAKMVSVVLHDRLDGEYLFIGHVGVLFEDQGTFYFIEKLAFEEPYQVIKTSNKEEIFDMLAKRYDDYFDEGGAKPFIMENDQMVAGAK